MWRRRSPRSIWQRRWPGPRWTPPQTRRLFSEQPPASSSHNPKSQVQKSWDCPFSHPRGWVLYCQQTGDVTNSRTLFKHATQFVQQHEWMEHIIPTQQVTTQLWETSAKGISQQLWLWRMFCRRTLCGDLKWLEAIASQLVTRADQPHRIRGVQMGPSVYKRFLWKISPCNWGKKGRVVQRNPSL